MSANKLIIAAAGSGKTTYIVDEVMKNKTERVLITTFTIANENSIRERLIKANNGCLPSNVIVQTWFSFLLAHGVRPYRFWEGRVAGMVPFSKPASVMTSFTRNGITVNVPFSEKTAFMKHYFSDNMNVYSSVLSKLVCRCDEQTGGYVIKRLEKVFKHIYIDEVQDLVGWDFELIKLFLNSQMSLTMVGDPRQVVYQTHQDKKNSKYASGKVMDFIRNECRDIDCKIDTETLNCSHRNSKEICDFASRLYQNEYSVCNSALKKDSEHMGIYFVKQTDIPLYMAKVKPMQLRDSIDDHRISADYPCMNFGASKGLDFAHVLVYTTEPMRQWLVNRKSKLKPTSRADLYVAVTRAFYSVGFVVPDNFSESVADIVLWEPSEK